MSNGIHYQVTLYIGLLCIAILLQVEGTCLMRVSGCLDMGVYAGGAACVNYGLVCLYVASTDCVFTHGMSMEICLRQIVFLSLYKKCGHVT